jgi:hypothetical protein
MLKERLKQATAAATFLQFMINNYLDIQRCIIYTAYKTSLSKPRDNHLCVYALNSLYDFC